jgi:hypothetical protein
MPGKKKSFGLRDHAPVQQTFLRRSSYELGALDSRGDSRVATGQKNCGYRG